MMIMTNDIQHASHPVFVCLFFPRLGQKARSHLSQHNTNTCTNTKHCEDGGCNVMNERHLLFMGAIKCGEGVFICIWPITINGLYMKLPAPTCFELSRRLFLIVHAYEHNGDTAKAVYHLISTYAFARGTKSSNSSGNSGCQ